MTTYQSMSPETKAKRAEATKRWRQRNPDRVREYNRKVEEKRKLGIYKESSRAARKAKRKERLAGSKRPDRCSVCDRGGKIVWDHCHQSGTFRGWICEPCNKVLGFCSDNPDVLRALAKYLDNAKKPDGLMVAA